VGTWHPSRRGWLSLDATNVDEQATVLSECVGFRVVVRRYRTRVRILSDGQHLRGVSSLRGFARVRGQMVGIQAVERFLGTKT
jgi:hypothetical protein